MALKAGRVGVDPSQVDNNGIIRNGGGGDISVIDNLSSTSSSDALSAKQGKILNDTKEDASKIGGLEFRDNDGQAQYRLNAEGEWQNFNSGTSGEGIVIDNPSSFTAGAKVTINDGGYKIIGDVVYINVDITVNSDADYNDIILNAVDMPNIAPPYDASVQAVSYENVKAQKLVLSNNSTYGDMFKPNNILNAGNYKILGLFIK